MVDGQPRARRRRRKQDEPTETSTAERTPGSADEAQDEHQDTMSTLAEEQRTMQQLAHECPVPKPKGFIGELLGFRDGRKISKEDD